MTAPTENPFATYFIASRTRRAHALEVEATAARPQIVASFDLDADLAKWRRKGYFSLGFSDVLGRAREFGFSNRLEGQAARVGAQVVLFCTWPAKLKAVARLPNGKIDLEALAADQPCGFSPKSYAVTRAHFLARRTEEET